MKRLELIACDDEMFGNTCMSKLVFRDGSSEFKKGQRPECYEGVHGLVNLFGDEFHLLSEDDGNFVTRVIINKQEVIKLHEHLSKLVKKFEFKGNYKVSFEYYQKANYWRGKVIYCQNEKLLKILDSNPN